MFVNLTTAVQLMGVSVPFGAVTVASFGTPFMCLNPIQALLSVRNTLFAIFYDGSESCNAHVNDSFINSKKLRLVYMVQHPYMGVL